MSSSHHKKQNSLVPFLEHASYEEGGSSGRGEGEVSLSQADDRHDSASGFGAAAAILGSPSASLYRMAHRGRGSSE